jgi:NADH-quinone oxidoreductase subunit L
MVICTLASAVVFYDVVNGNLYNGSVYTWLASANTRFEIGFLIDRLSATMMIVVSFVSLMVHIYTIGYMADDPGYQRFFSYISLFTFSMLMLVMSNNFLQLFFGWEAVGLVSYLLIGFWYTRPTAIYANLKAFLVNRASRSCSCISARWTMRKCSAPPPGSPPIRSRSFRTPPGRS